MDQVITRRAAIASVLLAANSRAETKIAQLKAIEMASGGRLGCSVFDTGTGQKFEYRSDERFPLCSTFKFLACAFCLYRVDQGKERLDRRIVYSAAQLVAYSPATELHAGPKGMTVADLCKAAVTLSDNTAANLLLASFGGPAGLTAFVRSVGDKVTRLDRMEPDLNQAKDGDPRDTTTPRAITDDLQKLLLAHKLSQSSRTTLTKWLTENQTGAARLRAGLPADWQVGDKTGSGENGTTNDIAIVWPPNRPPLLIAVYLTQGKGSADERNATIAAVGRVVSA